MNVSCVRPSLSHSMLIQPCNGPASPPINLCTCTKLGVGLLLSFTPIHMCVHHRHCKDTLARSLYAQQLPATCHIWPKPGQTLSRRQTCLCGHRLITRQRVPYDITPDGRGSCWKCSPTSNWAYLQHPGCGAQQAISGTAKPLCS